MDTHQLDLHAAALAQRQHGAFSLTQLLDVGASYQAVRARARDGRFLVLDTGVFGHPAHPATWHRQAKGAELRFARAAVSGRSAAVLHGIGSVRPGAIEVTVPPGGGRTSRLARVRHREVEHTTIDGIRVVTVGQTIVDLASARDPRLLEVAVEDALLHRLVTVDDLVGCREQMSDERARGAATLRRVLDEQMTGTVPPTNELERALYSLLDLTCFPDYQRQSPFPWWPWAPQRVDAYVPAWRRIIEADGRLWHTRRVDFERDKERDHLAQAHGIEVTRFTHRQLVRSPDYARRLLASIGALRHAA